MNSQLLYYQFLEAFNEYFYRNLITTGHLTDAETLFKSISDADGIKQEGVTVPGFPLIKDNIKYILPSKIPDGENGFRAINLSEDLPIVVTRKAKIFSNGVGYFQIKKFQTAKLRSEHKMTMRELVDKLCSMKHNNPKHQKLMTMLGISSMIDRTNFRLCTNPGFGKDSIVEICGNLFGDANTIENPTVAKLEYLSYVNWLAVNEVVDIGKSEWRNIEQFLLSAGALKEKIAKRSRANGTVGEFLDISRLSIALFFNDIDTYKDSEDFFDVKAKGSVEERFISFRFHGRYEEDFESAATVNVENTIKRNKGVYEDIIRTFAYYKQNLNDSLHFYKVKNNPFKSRHKLAFIRILKVVDAYSESQEEFDGWVNALIEANKEYYSFAREYPPLVEQLVTKVGEKDASNILKNKVRKLDTWADKKRLMNQYIVGKEVDIKTEEHGFW